MGNNGGKAVKRMASTNAPMKVTNKHFVLGNPIQGPFPDGMEKVVVGTGKNARFPVDVPLNASHKNTQYQDAFGEPKEASGRYQVYTPQQSDIVVVRSIIRRIVKFAPALRDITKLYLSFGTRKKYRSAIF